MSKSEKFTEAKAKPIPLATETAEAKDIPLAKVESPDNDPTLNIACIYDGSLESAIMIHKVVKDGKKVTVLQNDKVKFGKLNLPEENIAGIGEHKDESKILAYVKECGKLCIKKGIKFLYIGWSTDNMNNRIGKDKILQDLFLVGVPRTLAELTPEAEGSVVDEFVRAVFYNYGRSTEDISKNCKQYGYE